MRGFAIGITTPSSTTRSRRRCPKSLIQMRAGVSKYFYPDNGRQSNTGADKSGSTAAGAGDQLALGVHRRGMHGPVTDLGASQALGHDLEKLPALPWCQRCCQLMECCNLCIGE